MNKTSGRNHGFMNFGLYKNIIDDLAEFDKPIKVLRLYKDGEPLLNSSFLDMVRYAKASPCVDRIDTTTNASLLNKEYNLKLIDAGLDRINISIEGTSGKQYLDFSKCKLNFSRLVSNIEHLYQNKHDELEMIIKINGDLLTEEEKGFFLGVFGPIADGVFVEKVMSCWPTFDIGYDVDPDTGIYGQKTKEVMVCPYVFYSFSINSDGSASICFLDWNRSLLIGDLNKMSVKQVWQSEALLKYQFMFLEKKRKEHHFCGNCGQMTHGMPDDIDEYAEMLLKRMRYYNE